MRAISIGAVKAGGALAAVLAVAALSGCAAASSNDNVGTEAARQEYVVCSGGRASRFPEQQANGRYCRPALSLRDVY
jgi:hypothetical protein